MPDSRVIYPIARWFSHPLPASPRPGEARLGRCVWLALWLVLWCSGSIALEAEEDQGHRAHYIVFEMDRLGHIEPVFHTFVDLAHHPDPMAAEQYLAAISGKAEPSLGVEIWDGADVVFRTVIGRDLSVRGEFHGSTSAGGTSAIDGHRFAKDRESFVVRVPQVEGASLVLANGASRTPFDLDALAAGADHLPLANAVQALADQTRVTRLLTGDPGNRVDLLIMGDGFTSAGSFSTLAATLETEFFSVSPYGEYSGHVNVHTLFTPSAEAGADHPPFLANCPADDDPSCCADPEAQIDPASDTYVDTAFNGRFCSYNIHRLAVVDNSLVFAAAAAVPNWDHILMLLNDSTYGGSGGEIPVSTTHAAAVDVIRHEYGHSFTGLADEYEISFPGFPACSDTSGPACEPNVTDQTSPALIKWAPWIDGSTPIPTPEGSGHAEDVGLFEGARYLQAGMFRPREGNCLMRVLGAPFGEICAQSYVLRLYEGGWGIPASGIDPIEPGLEKPTPGSTVDFDSSTTFSTVLLEPTGGPPLNVTWWVDGEPQAGETGSSFVFAPTSGGCRTVEIKVSDATPFVHAAMAGTALQSSRTWTACAEASTLFQDDFESGDTTSWTVAVTG